MGNVLFVNLDRKWGMCYVLSDFKERGEHEESFRSAEFQLNFKNNNNFDCHLR